MRWRQRRCTAEISGQVKIVINKYYIWRIKPGRLLSFALLIGLPGCAHRPAARYQPPATAAAEAAPQLLFLSCRLTAGTAGSRLEVLDAKAEARLYPSAAITFAGTWAPTSSARGISTVKVLPWPSILSTEI